MNEHGNDDPSTGDSPGPGGGYSPDGLRARTASLARENEALRAQVERLRRFIVSMRRLARAGEETIDDSKVPQLLDEVLGRAMDAIGARDGSLLALDEDTGELVFVVVRGAVESELRWRRIPPGEGIAGWVAANRRATIVNDATLDERFYGRLDRDLEFQTRSVLAAPLLSGGRILGVIELLNKGSGASFDKNDEALLGLLGQFAGALLETVVEVADDDADDTGAPHDNGPTGAEADDDEPDDSGLTHTELLR